MALVGESSPVSRAVGRAVGRRSGSVCHTLATRSRARTRHVSLGNTCVAHRSLLSRKAFRPRVERVADGIEDILPHRAKGRAKAMTWSARPVLSFFSVYPPVCKRCTRITRQQPHVRRHPPQRRGHCTRLMSRSQPLVRCSARPHHTHHDVGAGDVGSDYGTGSKARRRLCWQQPRACLRP